MTERQVTKLSSKEFEFRKQLLELGISEADTARALSAVGSRGVQAALDFLFRSEDSKRKTQISKSNDFAGKHVKGQKCGSSSKAPTKQKCNVGDCDEKPRKKAKAVKDSDESDAAASDSEATRLRLKSSPEPPAKPQTARVLYIISCKDKVSKEHPTASFAELATIIDKRWKALTTSERRNWELMEKSEKEKYEAEVAKLRGHVVVSEGAALAPTSAPRKQASPRQDNKGDISGAKQEKSGKCKESPRADQPSAPSDRSLVGTFAARGGVVSGQEESCGSNSVAHRPDSEIGGIETAAREGIGCEVPGRAGEPERRKRKAGVRQIEPLTNINDFPPLPFSSSLCVAVPSNQRGGGDGCSESASKIEVEGGNANSRALTVQESKAGRPKISSEEGLSDDDVPIKRSARVKTTIRRPLLEAGDRILPAVDAETQPSKPASGKATLSTPKGKPRQLGAMNTEAVSETSKELPPSAPAPAPAVTEPTEGISGAGGDGEARSGCATPPSLSGDTTCSASTTVPSPSGARGRADSADPSEGGLRDSPATGEQEAASPIDGSEESASSARRSARCAEAAPAVNRVEAKKAWITRLTGRRLVPSSVAPTAPAASRLSGMLTRGACKEPFAAATNAVHGGAVLTGRAKRFSRGEAGAASLSQLSLASLRGSSKKAAANSAVQAMPQDDEEWAGFVPDLEAFRPPLGCGAGVFAKSATLLRYTEAAREKIMTDETLEALEEAEARPRAFEGRLTARLHSVLIHDWKLVCEDKQTHKLPREPCVAAILCDYAASRDKLPAGLRESSRRDMADGVAEYFERLVGGALLFDERERRMHQARLADGHSAGQSYGLEHLVRLVARLPALCAQCPMSARRSVETSAAFSDLVRFLDRLTPTILPGVLDM